MLQLEKMANEGILDQLPKKTAKKYYQRITISTNSI
jgi:hypothetical protein